MGDQFGSSEVCRVSDRYGVIAAEIRSAFSQYKSGTFLEIYREDVSYAAQNSDLDVSGLHLASKMIDLSESPFARRKILPADVYRFK